MIIFPQKKKAIETRNQKEREINLRMVNIPEKNYAIQQTKVTQMLYSKIMGELPTFFNEQGGNHPVVAVSLYDMVYFCNLLSTHVRLTPVYSVGGNTDIKTWNYTPHKGNAIKEEITLNEQASGYRLPTKEKWFWPDSSTSYDTGFRILRLAKWQIHVIL